MYIVVEADIKTLTNDFLLIIINRPNKDISPEDHLRTQPDHTDSKVRPYAIIHRLILFLIFV